MARHTTYCGAIRAVGKEGEREHRAMFVVVDYAYPSSRVASKRYCDYLTGLWLVKRFLYELQRKAPAIAR